MKELFSDYMKIVMLVIATVSITVNVVLGLKLADVPPQWFKQQVDRIESMLIQHLQEEECH